MSVVLEGEWGEFATFAGPRLNTIIGWDKIALIGDASHPLSGKEPRHYFSVHWSDKYTGAFGSGATFAMEDGWILARALEHTRHSSHPVRDALEIFSAIRSPYYNKM